MLNNNNNVEVQWLALSTPNLKTFPVIPGRIYFKKFIVKISSPAQESITQSELEVFETAG